MTAKDGPLAGIHPDTVYNLVRRARKYLNLETGEYKSSPPERRGDPYESLSPTYVSGRDVEQWQGKVARFRKVWEARSEEARAELLRLAREEQAAQERRAAGEKSGIDEIRSLVSWEE
jgi:hypothetical protein